MKNSALQGKTKSLRHSDPRKLSSKQKKKTKEKIDERIQLHTKDFFKDF